LNDKRIALSENRREYFRISYPKGGGPKLISGGVTYPVMNLSEQGLLLALPGRKTEMYTTGTVFSGSITFHDNESFLIIGTITRVSEDSIAVNLRKSIPLRIIMAEQRRLIQYFPKIA
jgi:hypothetical protein